MIVFHRVVCKLSTANLMCDAAAATAAAACRVCITLYSPLQGAAKSNYIFAVFFTPACHFSVKFCEFILSTRNYQIFTFFKYVKVVNFLPCT